MFLPQQHTGLADYFGPVFKVHKIIFVPFAAPNKALVFKGRHNGCGVTFLQGVRAQLAPAPVGGNAGADVKGNAKSMGAQAVFARYAPPSKTAVHLEQGFEARLVGSLRGKHGIGAVHGLRRCGRKVQMLAHQTGLHKMAAHGLGACAVQCLQQVV